jgi:hypothetical protein
MAVIKVRWNPAPLQFLRSYLLTRTLRELKTLNKTIRLVYIVHVFRNNGRIMKLLAYYAEPVRHLRVVPSLTP